MFSSAEFHSFSLSGRLRAVGLNALTRLSTEWVIYMNCAIKSLYLLRQCDVDNLINNQFQFQRKCCHVRFIKINVPILSLVGPWDRILYPLNVLLLVPLRHLFATWELCSWNCFFSDVDSGGGEILRVRRSSLFCVENAPMLMQKSKWFGVPFSWSLTAPSRQSDYIICTEFLLPGEVV